MKNELRDSIRGVTHWVEDHSYRAYDPGDGNLSYLRHITFKKQFLQRILTASVLRSPYHIRPLIGVRPHTSTKGMGYMAWGYLFMHELEPASGYGERAQACLEWLIKNRSPEWKQYCWGNHFTFCTRNGRLPAQSPTIVWSSLIGLAFLKGFEVLSEPRYLEVASSVADWILELPRERTSSGVCLSYVTFEQSSIHNSNMLGAGFLARVGRLTNHDDALETAREAIKYSCARQRGDGSWFYGEAPKNQWIDNFHTGYNLDSLFRYEDATGDMDYEGNLSRGFKFFKDNFFEPDGTPKYYHNRRSPIDIQCASQAIDTLARFADRDPEALSLAQKVAAWTIEHMQDSDGHFYYRDLGWKKVKTPMFHWGQGTTFKALSHLLACLERHTRSRKRDPQRIA